MTYQDFHRTSLGAHIVNTALLQVIANKNNIRLVGEQLMENCRICNPFKQRRKKVPTTIRDRTSVEFNGEIHIDIGSLEIAGVTHPFLILVEDKSEHIAWEPLESREAPEIKRAIARYIATHGSHGEAPIHTIHCDGEPAVARQLTVFEQTLSGIKNWLLETHKIKLKIDARDAPKVRGLVEKTIDRVKVMTRIIMFQANFRTTSLHKYYRFAVTHAIETLNNLTHRGPSPNELSNREHLGGKGILPRFGSIAEVVKTKTELNRQKGELKPRVDEVIFIGFFVDGSRLDYRKAYFFNPKTRRVIFSKDFRIYDGEYKEDLRNFDVELDRLIDSDDDDDAEGGTSDVDYRDEINGDEEEEEVMFACERGEIYSNTYDYMNACELKANKTSCSILRNSDFWKASNKGKESHC
jgi:hypothetical protein